MKGNDKLREAMKENGISQEYLGELLNLSSSCISKRMRGVVEWRINEIYEVLDILRIPYSQLQEYFPPKHKEVRKFTNDKNKVKTEELQMKQENNEKISVEVEQEKEKEKERVKNKEIVINIKVDNLTFNINK